MIVSNSGNVEYRRAVYDQDRKGIHIPAAQLDGSGFEVGDAFSVKKGQREMFSLTIVKDDSGDILFDKSGIFIERTRRVDIFLGGIFDEYTVYLHGGSNPMEIRLKPIDPLVERLGY